MTSPPKPWETAGAGTTAAATTTATAAAGLPATTYGSTGLTAGAYGPQQQGAYGTTAGAYGSQGMYGAAGSTYGASSMYGTGYGATGGYGSTNSMYGAGGYGSTGYGSSMYGGGGYGSSMYGGGGYGSSMYGGGYGGSMYGGGYGSSMYGGGYGSSMYGGSRFGGGYGGGYGGMMGGGPLSSEMGLLGGLHQSVGALGQMSELLGMNAEAMQFAFGAFAHFLERIGGASHDVVSFFMGTPPPMPIDPRTGQPMPPIDPRTGQPLPMPTPEEFKAERKKRMLRWLTGIVVVFIAFRMIRSWFSSRGGKRTGGLHSAPKVRMLTNGGFMDQGARYDMEMVFGGDSVPPVFPHQHGGQQAPLAGLASYPTPTAPQVKAASTTKPLAAAPSTQLDSFEASFSKKITS